MGVGSSRLCSENNINLGTHFDVCKTLGRGSFGKVVEAKQKSNGKLYAIKTIDKKKLLSKEKRYLKREIKMKELHHKNITEIFQCWEEGDILYIQMELCESDLANWFYKMSIENRQKDLSKLVDIIAGVKFLHSKEIIHRDLKVDIIF